MVQQINDQNFRKEVEKAEKAVIKFYADWCGQCRLFSPKYKRLAQDERFAGVHFLDVNAEQNPEIRKWAGVTNLPFFAVVKNGEIIEAVTLSKEEKLVEMLEKLN